jgi:hypothetical protein
MPEPRDLTLAERLELIRTLLDARWRTTDDEQVQRS